MIYQKSPFFLTIIIFGLCTACQTQKDEASLVKAIEIFNQAFKEGDVNKLSQMITENYQHTNGNSKAIDKEAWLNYLKQRQADIQSGKIIVDSYEMQDTKITQYGNMAVVTAKIITSNNSKESAYRVTNIWVVEGGEWKRAGFHDGKIQ